MAVLVSFISLALVLTVFHNLKCDANLLENRHSIHLSTSLPDSRTLALDNLESLANSLLKNRGRGRRHAVYPTKGNPYGSNPRCKPKDLFRTIDGTCNNKKDPWIGAAKTPLGRLAANTYEDNIGQARTAFHNSAGQMPTARKVSLAVTLLSTNMSSKHSHLLMNWGQFTDHDLTLSPESGGEGGEEGEKSQCCELERTEWLGNLKECMPVLTPNDPVFQRTCIPFLRSAPVPGFPQTKLVRNQLNDLTAWIDGSQVYGSTNLKATFLRTFVAGRLKSTRINGEESLPSEPDNNPNCKAAMAECQFASGDIRATEQAGLSSVHTLLLREHNRIAGKLQFINSHWDDERIYQVTRKIIGAILQRVTYNEFLPEVIGERLMKRFGLTLLHSGRFRGYSKTTDPSIVTEFSTAAFRFGHSLIRQTFKVSQSERVDLREMFEAFKTVDKFGTDGFMKGLARDSVEICDRKISFGMRDQLFGEEADLIAFNIQRGRDHGIASYNNIRRYLGLKPYKSFNALGSTSHTRAAANALNDVYPTTEDIEMFPGGISEKPLEKAVVGETFAHIIGIQFKRAKFADRFWHETPDKKVGFTDDQLKEIRTATLAQLYCENIPIVVVRPKILLLESHSNPTQSCGHIVKIDLNKWKENIKPNRPNRPQRPNRPNRFNRRFNRRNGNRKSKKRLGRRG